MIIEFVSAFTHHYGWLWWVVGLVGGAALLLSD